MAKFLPIVPTESVADHGEHGWAGMVNLDLCWYIEELLDQEEGNYGETRRVIFHMLNGRQIEMARDDIMEFGNEIFGTLQSVGAGVQWKAAVK